MSKTTGTTSEAGTAHSSGTSGFSGALVDLYIKLIFGEVFCRPLFVILLFFHFSSVCPSIYDFCFPLWYLQTFLTRKL